MNDAFYIGATALAAHQRSLDIVANNVANINTNAFKRSEVRFAELFADPPVDDAGVTPRRATPAGVDAYAIARIFDQGDLRETAKPLDLAIDGDGFIEVLGPAGQSWLWRGGPLKIDADGFLATSEGLQLKAQIQIPDGASSLIITRDGHVSAIDVGDGQRRELGIIELASVAEPAQLRSMSGGFYHATDEADIRSVTPGEANSGALVQGALEASNVDLSTEMVNLLLMQRAYAANAQVVQAGDQLMALANGLRR